MNAPLTQDELTALGRLSTPALANAIETFGIRPHTEGFTGPEIRPMFPALGTMVGFACTLRITAAHPRDEGRGGAPLPYWEYVAATGAGDHRLQPERRLHAGPAGRGLERRHPPLAETPHEDALIVAPRRFWEACS